MSLFGFNPRKIVAYAGELAFGTLALALQVKPASAQPIRKDAVPGYFVLAGAGLGIVVLIICCRCYRNICQRQQPAAGDYQQLQAQAPAP